MGRSESSRGGVEARRCLHVLACCAASMMVVGCAGSGGGGRAAGRVVGNGPGARAGTATVSGVAYVQPSPDRVVHAAGRVVRLIPRNDETTQYVAFISKNQGDPGANNGLAMYGNLFAMAGGKYSEPSSAAREGYGTLGYGRGRFVFQHVAPGEYYVVFRPPTQNLPGTPVSVATVRVEAGQNVTDVVVHRPYTAATP